jgi:dipeptidyl aminopeptidase/acylaminoacyl peptidase
LARQEAAFAANPSFHPLAILDFFGPTDLTKILDGPATGNPGRDAAIKLLQASPEQLPNKARVASPVSYLTMRNPPILIFHGLKDHLVPVSQSQELHSMLTTVGVKHELLVVDNADHDGPLFSTPDIQAKVIAFLKEAFRNR